MPIVQHDITQIQELGAGLCATGTAAKRELIMNNRRRLTAGNFLKSIDNYIKDNLFVLTKADVLGIYTECRDAQKKLKGNANGFTGLSEYLIFRLVFNLISGFTKDPGNSVSITKDVDAFSFGREPKSKLLLTQGVSLATLENKKMIDGSFGDLRPDIALIQGKKLIAVCEIKIYFSAGGSGVKKEIGRLGKLGLKLHPLIVVFGKAPEELKNRRDVDFMSLRGDGDSPVPISDAISSKFLCAIEGWETNYKKRKKEAL